MLHGGHGGHGQWDNCGLLRGNATPLGAYTIYVSGEVQVGDIHVDRGDVTFEPDPVNGGSLETG